MSFDCDVGGVDLICCDVGCFCFCFCFSRLCVRCLTWNPQGFLKCVVELGGSFDECETFDQFDSTSVIAVDDCTIVPPTKNFTTLVELHVVWNDTYEVPQLMMLGYTTSGLGLEFLM